MCVKVHCLSNHRFMHSNNTCCMGAIILINYTSIKPAHLVSVKPFREATTVLRMFAIGNQIENSEK